MPLKKVLEKIELLEFLNKCYLSRPKKKNRLNFKIFQSLLFRSLLVSGFILLFAFIGFNSFWSYGSIKCVGILFSVRVFRAETLTGGLVRSIICENRGQRKKIKRKQVCVCMGCFFSLFSFSKSCEWHCSHKITYLTISVSRFSTHKKRNRWFVVSKELFCCHCQPLQPIGNLISFVGWCDFVTHGSKCAKKRDSKLHLI